MSEPHFESFWTGKETPVGEEPWGRILFRDGEQTLAFRNFSDKTAMEVMMNGLEGEEPSVSQLVSDYGFSKVG